MLKRIFAAFEYREFRLLWFGACTSSIGTWMQKLAQSWLVLQLSNRPFLLGLDSFLGEIPILLFSLIGGVIADRMDRRKLLIGSQVVQMSCAFLLAGLFASGRRARLAHPGAVVRGGVRAGVRRARVPGADPDPGAAQGPARTRSR